MRAEVGRCGLQTTFRRIDTIGVLELDGELDIATAAALRTELDAAVAQIPAITTLVLDVAEVRFCGTRIMIGLSETACPVARRGGRLFLARCPRMVLRLIEMLGVPHRPHPLSHPIDPRGLELLPGPVAPPPAPPR